MGCIRPRPVETIYRLVIVRTELQAAAEQRLLRRRRSRRGRGAADRACAVGRGLVLLAVQGTREAGKRGFISIIQIRVLRLRVNRQRLGGTPVEDAEEVVAGHTHHPPQLLVMLRLLLRVVEGRARVPVSGVEIVAKVSVVEAAVLHNTRSLTG